MNGINLKEKIERINEVINGIERHSRLNPEDFPLVVSALRSRQDSLIELLTVIEDDLRTLE
jgi:hypothetical protein